MAAGHVAVLGAGSWGTALAILLARNGHPTRLWGRDPAALGAMQAARCNARYLPDARFPESLEIEPDLARAADGAALAVVAVPSAAFSGVVSRLTAVCAPPLLWATKGFDPATGTLLHAVVAACLGPGAPAAVLSGPTFAREVAADLPAAVTIASRDPGFAEAAARIFHGARFRAYTSDDVPGVEAGGAVKNVLAVAAGVADGLGFGANTRAALIARGLQEMMRFGECAGGRRETFMGLAGLGDLVLTCTDDQSRNRRFGLALARGLDVPGALAEVGQTVEGLGTTREVVAAARAAAVEMPIAEQVHALLFEAVAPLDAVEALLGRAPGPEMR